MNLVKYRYNRWDFNHYKHIVQKTHRQGSDMALQYWEKQS